ncbi:MULTISPECIES: DEAD/DEAH box helicase [unclassified Nocardioides]|uniref:DEAD/DEAH box helicase n=1 Tax=unclassified Nocardioides TaxID=2615069 RepID=UPI0007038103|nr:MULTISPECIES: DEAD/DEAH box helicase family protein [unclassified Nocardioides]KRC56662.1 hypothetical protein ASE19_02210 [Nocardioides sp. Root79]KRC76873.1 hypothetical protein ASE20_01080 [Nocardioides sp. Root240]
MRFGLKDYQAEAVASVLAGLGNARAMVDLHMKTSLALTAPTGAGKTVMAAAIIEALFFGSDDLDVLPDPRATVLWFTSDPSLNEQTRHRIQQASDRLTPNRLVVVPSTFAEERLEPGTVYFLNSQKLSRNSLLVRGGGAGDEGEMLAAPDMRARTFWEVLRNTIEHDGTTLYVVLDEAHIGMNTSKRDLGEKSTIVRALVNGEAGAPAVPIVLGISATIDRFRGAMEQADGRTTLPDVSVDPARVQESGLLKDNVLLSFPAEIGAFDTVLLRHAVQRTREASELWAAYHAEQQDHGAAVQPLLVVQVPNKPSDELLADAVTTILDEWPELSSANVANVFGDGTPLSVGGHEIEYVAPQDVAERTHVRVLLAKDAISTGWDCPRAEVLVSFRPAQDLTHITQLLGRMVRTPLARRIAGDDRLNAVECFLPLFNRANAQQVARQIMGAGSPGPVISPATSAFRRNSDVDESVWEAFDRLPSQTVPRKGSKPVSRFTALAAALARDGIRPGAYDSAIKSLVDFLRGKAVQYATRVEEQIADLQEMTGETIVVGMGPESTTVRTSFSLRVDDRAVDQEYKVARRTLSPQLAAAYAEVLEDEYDDGYFEAHLRTAALARLSDVVEQLGAEADRMFSGWDAEHRVAIKDLPDERRAVYEELRSLAGYPVPADVERPLVRMEVTEDAAGKVLATHPRHLLSDADGRFPTGSLLGWERAVLDAEIGRSVAWYRNPSRASADAIAIAYLDAQREWRRLCPDFIFFQEVRGEIRSSIVDPHGTHLGDALPKLRGLARYAEDFADDLHRVEAVAEVDGQLRVLDLTLPHVRQAVSDADSVKDLYLSSAGADYVTG